MKRILIVLVAFLMMASMVLAIKPADTPKAQHLYLYEKTDFCAIPYTDPDCWSILEGGAWGKMMYQEDMFVFNGHHVVPGTEYSLISYKEPWPGENSTLLGTGVADDFGDVHIAGDYGYDDFVYNDYNGTFGAKIWLVPSVDFDGTSFIAWDPSEYLFEGNLILQ